MAEVETIQVRLPPDMVTRILELEMTEWEREHRKTRPPAEFVQRWIARHLEMYSGRALPTMDDLR